MNINTPIKAIKSAGTGPTTEKVLSVTHWTNFLFSFKTTRPSSFRYRSGEFVMMGLMAEGKPLLRAYSIASPNWDDELEFFSIKVPDGPLTSRLQLIKPGHEILLGRKPVGTLVLDALKPGKNLYLLSSGTGFAPFASILRDPETYDKFDRIIVTHTCREAMELEYSKHTIGNMMEHAFLGELASGKLYYFESVTRAPYFRNGRITTLIQNGDLFKSVDLPPFDPATDRVMFCGSNAMIADTEILLEQAGLTEGSNAKPAEFVIEKAFVG